MNYELIHDTIAKLVYDKASTEARTRRKIEKYIRERYQAFQNRGARLTRDDLDYITPYLEMVRISSEEESFLEKERQALVLKRRKRFLLVVSIIAVLALISSIAVWQWYQAELSEKRAVAEQARAEKNEKVAIKAKEDALAQKAIADTARKEAEYQESEALAAKEEVQRKLDIILREKRKRVEELFKQFPGTINRLAFSESRQMVDEILSINANPQATKAAVAELLFFYAYSQQPEKGFSLLKKARHLFPAKLTVPIPDSVAFLKKAIQQNISGRLLSQLNQTYFPHAISIQAATFWMGSMEDKEARYRKKEEVPHKVRLSGFQMGQTEVTVLQYLVFAKATGKPMPKNLDWEMRGDQPIVTVNWYDAVSYCNWLSEQHGFTPAYKLKGDATVPNWVTTANGYRLPTEAEWMYAAGGGKTIVGSQATASLFAGGDDIKTLGWYKQNSDARVHSVKQKQPNEWKLYDMSGNVWEWCWDVYSEDYYEICKTQGVVTNPAGPPGNPASPRVNLGGGIGSRSSSCRINNRSQDKPEDANDGLGFRICRSF